MQDVTLLRDSLPYLRRFRGTIFVVKFGGEAMRDRATLERLAEDLALLHFVGVKVVVVHGGGAQVTELEKKLGIASRFVGGRRVTDEASLGALKQVLAGQMNVDIVAALRGQGAKALGFCGVSANLIQATKREPRKVSGGGDEIVDFGHVGDIQAIDPAAIHMALREDLIPVVAPLGADAEGNALNINADTVAARLAVELKASKLLLMTAQLGVLEELNDPTTLISQLDIKEAREGIDEGWIHGGMIPKIEEALKAVEAGVPQAHIISALEPHQLLLEIFTESGCGTMLTPE